MGNPIDELLNDISTIKQATGTIIDPLRGLEVTSTGLSAEIFDKKAKEIMRLNDISAIHQTLGTGSFEQQRASVSETDLNKKDTNVKETKDNVGRCNMIRNPFGGISTDDIDKAVEELSLSENWDDVYY